MLKDIPQSQWPEALFTNLVLTISNAAMMALGKIVDPANKKVEKDLDMAQLNIEMLAMLQEKTRNNLGEKEKTLLETYLTNLRLTYVKEIQSKS
jgi:hypothetical protein